MITVHHLQNSRSQRILWLLEELGLDYQLKRYRRDPETMLAPQELRRAHRLGKAPVICDDGEVLAESGAIIQYLIDRYAAGKLQPLHGSPQRLRYTYWMHYAEGSAMPPLVMNLVFDRIPKAKMPGLLRPLVRMISRRVHASYIKPQLALHLDYMQQALTRSRWFAGTNFSAADIQMSFPVETAHAVGLLDETHPQLVEFLERIHSRSAYRRALDRGGPYDFASG